MFVCGSDITGDQNGKQMLSICFKNIRISKLIVITLLVPDFDFQKIKLEGIFKIQIEVM